MFVREITMKGFKSFPDRTRLEFGPGVSVIVGPNGSGKSNVTDAILWVLGEQSPAAIRGRSMQDVIFAGGHGVQARSSAEVELVLDNSDGTVPLPFSEISVSRKITREGEGEYRLNGAKCRLSDVIELLSDAGLGKEMHSVISQGRVEAIVTSKPKDRRLLLEEAAGLGKHRRRRRAAQRKLDRTEQNLARVIDVEREARRRLGPLKRQAEAAELRSRLERQLAEARWELLGDAVRARTAEETEASAAVEQLQAARRGLDEQLVQVAARRGAAELQLQQRSAKREAMARRASQLRSLTERQAERAERAASIAQEAAERLAGRERNLENLREQTEADGGELPGAERIAQLKGLIAELDVARADTLQRELAELESVREAAVAEAAAVAARSAALEAAVAEAESKLDDARATEREQEQAVQTARREAARVGGELASANQFLAARSGSAPGGAKSLADGLDVVPGLEGVVAAALGARLGAALAGSREEGEALLQRAGRDGGLVLLPGVDPGDAAAPDGPPTATGPLASAILGDGEHAVTARRLLRGTWLVDKLDDAVPDAVRVVVVRDGTVWDRAGGELRRAPQDAGEERVLAERNRRDQLVDASEQAVRAEQAARSALEQQEWKLAELAGERDVARQAEREQSRERVVADEAVRRAGWAIEERRRMPESGDAAVRRAQLAGELDAEERGLERAERERAQRAAQIQLIAGKVEADRRLVPEADRLSELLHVFSGVIADAAAAADAELVADREAGESVATELRNCSLEEAELQQQHRRRGDELTGAEVRKQRARDQRTEAAAQLTVVAEQLGLEDGPRAEAIAPERVEELSRSAERLQRRAEQLGPVNPLAEQEYAEALEHSELMETQRTDLEAALRELHSLIEETDKQIRDTFEQTFRAAERNFRDLSAQLFPGGSGRLRLVEEEQAIAEGSEPAPEAGDGGADAAEDAEERAAGEDTAGVEIEITPAGKSAKRLSLLSGGEKSMTALAFMFSVFLASPCPFYVLDEVEAALDDLNITRFLELLRAYRDRAQFIVVTHQKRTMEAADVLYGVSMAGDGVSKVISRRLSEAEATPA